MLIRFLQATPYTPTKADSLRCYGQLRMRPTQIASEVDVEVTKPDGTKEIVPTTQTTCGPMEHFFPKGATPNLETGVAEAFVAAGVAEQIDNSSVASLVSREEIMQDVKVQ